MEANQAILLQEQADPFESGFVCVVTSRSHFSHDVVHLDERNGGEGEG